MLHHVVVHSSCLVSKLLLWIVELAYHSRQSAHRVPQRQDDGVLAQHALDFLAEEPRVHDGLVDKLVHPATNQS